MENKITKSLVIIGGGPAGLAAAVAAAENGLPAEDILILERDGRLGGILNQCIHNGFGLHTFKEELTGPEYAARFEERAKALHIPYKLGAMVLSISPEKVVTAVSREDGLFTVEAGAVILAMGCRERSRGALNIPGFRPAGVFSAGTAQRLVNMEGYMPGREVVILGSGDIGLIMARRMTLEGAKVHVVAELQPYSGGLKRNIVQCLDDFGIPLKLSHTVTEIHGKDRVTGVTISAVDDKLKPIPGTEEYYSCDTLLLSAGELRRFSFLEAFQLNQLQHFLNLFLYIRFWYFSYFQTIPDVIRHVHMGKKGIILKYRVHISLVWLQIRHIFPLQPYTSAVRLLKSCDDAKSGRLAAAGSTQQGDEFPLINLQIDSL